MNNNNRNTECRERKKPPFAKKYTTFKSNHFGWSFSQFRNKSWINPVRNNPSPKNHRIQGSFGAINQVMIFVKCQIKQMKEKMRKLLIKIKEKEMDERKSSTPSPSPTPSPNTFPSSSPPQSSDPSLSSKEESSSPTSSLSTTGERDQREDVGVSNPVAFLLSSHLNLKSPPSQRHSPSIKMYISSLLFLLAPACLFQVVYASEPLQPVRRYQCASWVPQVDCLKSASSFSQMMLTRTMRPKGGMATAAALPRSAAAAPPPTKNCGGSPNGMAIMDGPVQGGSCMRNRPSPKATPGSAPTTLPTSTRTPSTPQETERKI